MYVYNYILQIHTHTYTNEVRPESTQNLNNVINFFANLCIGSNASLKHVFFSSTFSFKFWGRYFTPYVVKTIRFSLV